MAKPDQETKMVVVLDGVPIGHDPDVAAVLARAIVGECVRQERDIDPEKRARVELYAIGKAFVGLKLVAFGPPTVRATHFREAKIIFRTVVQEALHRMRERTETVTGTLITNVVSGESRIK